MKLSQFKGTNVRKRLQFINGEIKQISSEGQLIGDIDFYTLDVDRLELIHNEVIDKLDDSDSNDLLMYKIIPYICNIEVDITFDEFALMLKTPSKIFMALIEEIIMSINDMFETIGRLSQVIDRTQELTDNANMLEEDIEDIEIVEDIEEIDNNVGEVADLDKDALLDSLYEELGKTSDREIRKKIIKRITELQL